MDASFSDLYTRLNVWLRDSGDQTFTAPEKTELLTSAIRDPFVSKPVYDTSNTSGQNTYDMPTGMEHIYRLGIDLNDDGYFHRIGRENYSVVDGTLYLDTVLPSGHALQMVGHQKLDTSDTFPVKVQDYILHNAMVGAFELLKTSLTTRFVKNDMTMGDIINSLATHERKAAALKQVLINQQLTDI